MKWMPGTRVNVIEKIKKWAKEETGAPAEPICWVNADRYHNFPHSLKMRKNLS